MATKPKPAPKAATDRIAAVIGKRWGIPAPTYTDKRIRGETYPIALADVRDLIDFAYSTGRRHGEVSRGK